MLTQHLAALAKPTLIGWFLRRIDTLRNYPYSVHKAFCRVEGRCNIQLIPAVDHPPTRRSARAVCGGQTSAGTQLRSQTRPFGYHPLDAVRALQCPTTSYPKHVQTSYPTHVQTSYPTRVRKRHCQQRTSSTSAQMRKRWCSSVQTCLNAGVAE
jgi:hypothetical protein